MITADRHLTSKAETPAGATILPFRRRETVARPADPVTQRNASTVAAALSSSHPVPPLAGQPGDDAQARLVASLARLQLALQEQRVAVAQWRGALDTLRGSLGTLGQSFEGYRNRLTTLGNEVGQLNSQAHELESWADQVIAKAGKLAP